MAIGEEGGFQVSTQSVGEEGGNSFPDFQLSTQAIGEEGGNAFPKQQVSTMAVGEEGGNGLTPDRSTRVWEEGGGGYTTMAIGEDGQVSTMAVGEEGGSANMVQQQQNTVTSMAIGEEGGGFRRIEKDDRFQVTTLAIGEEGGDDFFTPITAPTIRPTWRITVDPTRQQMPAPTKRPTKVDLQYMGYLEYNVECMLLQADNASKETCLAAGCTPSCISYKAKKPVKCKRLSMDMCLSVKGCRLKGKKNKTCKGRGSWE